MTLTEARAVVKEFVSQWPTDKICAVQAFCEDGNMRYSSCCSCLIGVASSDGLHQHCLSSPGHYLAYREKHGDPNRRDWLGYPRILAEQAYWRLGVSGDYSEVVGDQNLRDREFIAILKQVLAERESNQSEEQAVNLTEQLVSTCS
jgi:hypothetical protein